MNDGDRATWATDGGETETEAFRSYAQPVKHAATHVGDALRFCDLRHSYATWLVDDEVPPYMVQRVMGHEQRRPRSSSMLAAPSITAEFAKL
jgi:integrase